MGENHEKLMDTSTLFEIQMEYLDVISEINDKSRDLWLKCDGCDKILHNGFIRDQYGQKSRNYCNHCMDCDPKQTQPEGEDCLWWWDYDQERIEEDIVSWRYLFLNMRD